MLVDTDVWSHLFVPGRRPPDVMADLRRQLLGVQVVIATQTRAEVLGGLASSDWGDRRRQDVRDQLDRTATAPVGEQVVQAYADLVAACKRAGHALQHKAHTADRWVAATAVAWNLSLLSRDRIYQDAPGLRLWSEVGR